MVHVLTMTNAGDVEDWLSGIQRREIPFATALALTTLAKDIKEDIPSLLERRFDRPTPFTKRGAAIKAATKRNLESRVFIKDKQAAYLSIQSTGGVRRPKRKALVVPARTRRNKYGNLPRGSVKRLLARSDTFSGKVRGTPGIWQRMKSGRLKLLVSYAPQAAYKPRIDFAGEVHALADRKARRAFQSAFTRVSG